jgi:beta-xylosidase
MKTVALLALAAAAVAAVAETTYTNPVVAVDAPDPGVLHWGGSYWMVATTGDSFPAFSIRSSDDLVHWKLVGHMFDAKTKPEWATKCFWAPELHVLPRSGKLVAVFSACDSAGELAVGSAWAEHPAGPWHAYPTKLARHKLGAIDAHVAIDNATADPYLVWKVNGPAKVTPLVAQRLSDDASATLSDAVTLIDVDQTWEGPLIEGPFILFQQGWYYLFYSGTPYSDPSYAVGVARARSLLGPYQKAAGPVLSQIADKAQGQPFTGPGHCSVVRVPETGAVVMVYHSWLRGHVMAPPYRVVLTDRVWFDAPGSDGWPVVGAAGSPSAAPLPIPTSLVSARMPAD